MFPSPRTLLEELDGTALERWLEGKLWNGCSDCKHFDSKTNLCRVNKNSPSEAKSDQSRCNYKPSKYVPIDGAPDPEVKREEFRKQYWKGRDFLLEVF